MPGGDCTLVDGTEDPKAEGTGQVTGLACSANDERVWSTAWGKDRGLQAIKGGAVE